MNVRDLRKRVPYQIQRDVLDELSSYFVLLCFIIFYFSLFIRCTGPRFKSCFLSFVPLLTWLPRYPFRDNAIGDLISGISVGIMHLPQGMAYALLAAVPPVFGLYSSFYPILIYFIFGTSKHISVGTYAVMSVMIGSVTERLAPDSDFMIPGNDTNSTTLDIIGRDAERVKIAATVTFLSGIFQLLLGLVRFGFVVTYLSEPLVRAYTTAAAIHVIVSQLKYSFGISPQRYSGPLSLIYTVIEICALLGKTNIGTLVVSIVTILGLVAAKELSALAARKIPVPIPVELITIIVATVVSWQMDLKTEYGVEVVGQIPSGLQAPVAPAVSLLGSMVGDAFALAVVGYGIAISLGRIFALKYAYKVDSNQELIALGLSNAIGGLFNCFAISCSMSRSMVQVSTGGKSQVAGAISAVVILVILLKIGELFEELPKAVLAAIIYVNLHGMMKQFGDICSLWRTNKVDMVVWVMTMILTVLLNPDLGLAASIAFSILTVVFRTQLPKYSILGQVPGTDIYRPVEDYHQVKEIPGIMIFRSSATLYFANAEMYIDALYEKTGVDVAKLLSHKKKLEAKRLRKEKKAAKKANKEAKKRAIEAADKAAKVLVSAFNQGEEPQFSETDDSGEEPELSHAEANGDVNKLSVKESKDVATVEVGPDPDSTLPQAIILDLSPVNFLDTVGVKTLRNIYKDYGEAGVQVYLCGCQRGVVESMEKGDFFNEKVTKSILFSSVHDAVLYSQQGNSKEVQYILISHRHTYQRFPNLNKTYVECWWPRQYFETSMHE
uniref:Solute carrier family 26 member 6 n=1 Tax=Cyprinus carpio TaxID=7962 RepID=A0A8C1T1P2_CYPCA